MKIIPPALLIVIAVSLGLSRSRSEGLEPWDATATALLAAVIIAWFPLSRWLIGYVDARNRTKRIAGLAGFLVLLMAIFSVAWVAFRLKKNFSPALDFSVSFQDDVAWLVIFPLVFHLMTGGKRVNNAPAPMAGTSPAAQEPRQP